MAFPAVQATATSSEFGASVSSHTVSLPSGISSGDLLIVIFSSNGNEAVGWPAGWTEIFQVDVGSDSNSATIAVAYRDADGAEGATITVTTGSNEESSANAYRITGHEDPSTQAPEVSAGASNASSTKPDPDSLAPAGGAKDYLWIAACGKNERTVTAAPTNYTDFLVVDPTSWSQNGCHSARRELNAASEDPGTFQSASSDAWVACTIAVHPAGVGGPVVGYVPWMQEEYA